MDLLNVQRMKGKYEKYIPRSKRDMMERHFWKIDDYNSIVALDKVEYDLVSPTKAFGWSFFLGLLGLDRFIINDIGGGVRKIIFGPFLLILSVMAEFIAVNFLSGYLSPEVISQISAIVPWLTGALAVVTAGQWITDWFEVPQKVREDNFEKIMSVL